MAKDNLFYLFCRWKCDEEIRQLLSIIEDQAETIVNLSRPKANGIHLSLTTIINNSKFSIMSLSILSNQSVTGVLSLTDSVTNAPVAATFSGITAVSDNTAVATVTVNADGSVTAQGVSAGTANITITSVAAFTNSLGVATSGTVSAIVPISVAAVPVADGVTLVVTWGAPTP